MQNQDENGNWPSGDKQDEDQALSLRLLCSAISLKSALYDFGEVPEQPIVS